jgi:hypothetical protein
VLVRVEVESLYMGTVPVGDDATFYKKFTLFLFSFLRTSDLNTERSDQDSFRE